MSQNSFKKRIALLVAVSVWTVAGFAIAQLLVGVILVLLTALGVPFASVNETVFTSIGNAVVYALAIGIVVGVPWLVRKKRTTLADIGLQRLPTWNELLMAPLGMVGYLILTSIIMALAMVALPFVDYTQAQQVGFSQLSSQLEFTLAFISLVVIAPFAEEVLFRGYLLGKLRQHVPTWIAILVTSIIFGVVHLQWNVGLDVFALSIVLCLLRVQSGSLWPSILLHMLKNGVAFYFLFINPIVAVTIGG